MRFTHTLFSPSPVGVGGGRTVSVLTICMWGNWCLILRWPSRVASHQSGAGQTEKCLRVPLDFVDEV